MICFSFGLRVAVKNLKTKDQVELNLIEIILSQYLW